MSSIKKKQIALNKALKLAKQIRNLDNFEVPDFENSKIIKKKDKIILKKLKN